MFDRLPLGGGIEVTLDARDDQWHVTPRHVHGGLCRPGEGASAQLIRLLTEGPEVTDRWQVLRLAALAPVGGERALDVDQTNTSVVVGERYVVKWLRSVADRSHPAMAALAQLEAVGFARTPSTYAVLTWTSPSGHTLPIAYVTDYLTAAYDGWTWCVDSVRSLADGSDALVPPEDLAGELGVLTASLHAALATPSRVFPRPVHPAGASRVQRWYDGAFAMLEQALNLPDADTAAAVSARAGAIGRCFDEALGDDAALADTPVQHIHADLHVGQILRWSKGLAVVDFDGNPVVGHEEGMVHPPARDVAQMVCSLLHVGQVVLRHYPDLDGGPVREWMSGCREQFVGAYRDALQAKGMSSLLDERLLPAFEVEQELRELVYASRHLPGWAYAPLATFVDLVPTGG